MIPIATIAEVRAIEVEADASGISYEEMMERAGRAISKRALQLTTHLPDPKFTILVGGGNNGGDGILAGLFIAQANSNALVRFYLLKDRPTDPYLAVAKEANLLVAMSEDDRDKRLLKNMVASSDVVVDALFGIGVRLPIRDEAQRFLRAANQALHERENDAKSDETTFPFQPEQNKPSLAPIYVLAVDIPSGLEADTGQLDKNAIHANETLTFIVAKKGLLSSDGMSAVGNLSVNDLSIPAKIIKKHANQYHLATPSHIRSQMPTRTLNSNKGTFGKSLIITGSSNYYGATLLATEGAYRSGAGLVRVATPAPLVASLAPHIPEATWIPLSHTEGAIAPSSLNEIEPYLSGVDSVLIGCGIGQAPSTLQFLKDILPKLTNALVLDADALNLLSVIPQWHLLIPHDAILTPHPTEMARLCQQETSFILANRWDIVAEKAKEWGVTVVLKGAHTLIANSEGDVVALPFKTDALATAGTGDVLAGMIGGFLAQGLPSHQAALVGAYSHGLAGKLTGEKRHPRSTIARDILNEIENVFKVLRM